MCQKNALKKNMLIYYLQAKKIKNIISLSKILISLCMIIHYIVKRKHFCCYCLQAVSTEETLKHIKDCF